MSIIADRIKAISEPMLTDNTKMYRRVIGLSNKCEDVNNAFRRWILANESPKDLAEECVEISLKADSILYELYISGQVELEEIEQMFKDKIQKW